MSKRERKDCAAHEPLYETELAKGERRHSSCSTNQNNSNSSSDNRCSRSSSRPFSDAGATAQPPSTLSSSTALFRATETVTPVSRKQQPTGEASVPITVTDGSGASKNRVGGKPSAVKAGEMVEEMAGFDLPVPDIPAYLVFRKNPDEDSFGLKALLEMLTSPVVYGYFRSAFRAVAFVAFPLYTIGSHPNTMARLGSPQCVVSSVISFSISKESFGSHAGVHSWALRSIAFMLIFGTVGAALQLGHHHGAWYGYIGTGIFCASLCANSSIRRFLYIFFFVHMMIIRYEDYNYGFVKMTTAAWFAADMCIGSLMGLAATLFPYPVFVHTTLDGIITKLFAGLGKMILSMEMYVASPDVCAAEAFFSDHAPLEKLEAGLGHLPPLLWFANWEPLEFPLRNPIRRLKLAFLRRVVSLTYAAFECGRTIAGLRKELARRKDAQRLREDRRAACGFARRHSGDSDKAKPTDNGASRGPVPPSTPHEAHKEGAIGEEQGKEMLEKNTHECVLDFVTALSQCMSLIGATESTPAAVLAAVPFTPLVEKETLMRRNFRMEILQGMYLQRERVSRAMAATDAHSSNGEDASMEGRQDEKVANADRETNQWTRHLSPKEHQLVLSYEEVIDEVEIFLSLHRVFFLMLLGMICSEVTAFEETMKAYQPAKSLYCRLIDFFIVEPWNGFWEVVWEQLTFATPQHVRTVKDALKMASAFLVACAFNYEIWIPKGGMYFFGVTTVLGMPVEEETVTTMICRTVGNTIGCALGYLAANNTRNYAQLIATAMCFAFLCRLVSHHSVFGSGFAYSGTITLAMALSGTNPLEVLSRVVAGIYCGLGYSLCCMIIFPTNPVKILWGYRVKLTKSFSDLLDDAAATARLPLNTPSVERQGNELCSQMNVQVALVKRMLNMCAKWTPFGANYPMIRGTGKFPGAASGQIHCCQTRLVANFELLVFNLQLLRRPRDEPVNYVVTRTLAGPLSALLDALAGAVRLISQDFIDSLQRCRQFSYSTLLTHVSYLARMRLRLRAILYESYVFLSQLSKGLSEGMTVEDYREVQEEQVQRRKGNSPLAVDNRNPNAGVPGSMVEVKVDENDDPTPLPRQSNELTATPLQQGQSGQQTVMPPSVSPPDLFDANASFADRYLLRQALGSTPPSPANGAQAAGVDNATSPNNAVDLGSITASFARRRAFRFQAPLQEVQGEPKGSYPMGPEDPCRSLRQELLRQRQGRQKWQVQRGEVGDGNRLVTGSNVASSELSFSREPGHQHEEDGAVAAADSALPSPPPAAAVFDIARPHKQASTLEKAFSRLIRKAGTIDSVGIPPYQGPTFNYREDALESPVDTDFMALVAILSSCDGVIAELQRMAPGVNETSGYQRNLHETTSCLACIDGLSTAVVGKRKSVYERYHGPSAVPPSGTHETLNAQDDMWQDWRF